MNYFKTEFRKELSRNRVSGLHHVRSKFSPDPVVFAKILEFSRVTSKEAVILFQRISMSDGRGNKASRVFGISVTI
jgi:hypothetical protein